jgi:ferritin-like metal-binding protein YciE
VKPKNLNDLLLHEVRELYYVEKNLLKALDKMAKKATHEDLKAAFEDHRAQTEQHVERLETIFGELDRKPSTHKCKGIDGILEEGEELAEEITDPDTLDAALITAAQRSEHYEMAAYGGARAYAELLGMDKTAKLLRQTLDEEKETDKKLSELAMSHINEEALR